MIITVASGKGGTGKTTVATSLAAAISELSPRFLDCDVEAPNAHIFLQPQLTHRQEIAVPIPAVEMELCTGCGRCAEICPYHAIVLVGGKVLVFPELCHGCGSCTLQCPEGAIHEVPHPLGMLEAGLVREGFEFARGVLNIGEPMAVPIIRALNRWRPMREGLTIIRDAPPGASCPVVESMRGADFVLLVTEPTPFGLHDLQLAVELAGELEIPAGVVVNRDGIGNRSVDEYCRQVGIPILMRIPLDLRIGEALARGELLLDAFPEFHPTFGELYSKIKAIITAGRTTAVSAAKKPGEAENLQVG